MSASTDVESQSPAARSRGRSLDTFLTVSVIALFIMFAIALASGLWFFKHIEDEINEINERKSPQLDGSTDSLVATLPPTGNAYKMQNFAYLRATESELKSENVMAWEPLKYGQGDTVGSLYSYDGSHKALNVNKSGSYFLYVQLSLSCKADCHRGQFTVSFYNKHNSKVLTCTVSLPEESGEEPVSRTCWRVVTFQKNGDRLLAKSDMKGTLDHWRLQMNDSLFGIFLVDGVQEART